MFMADYYIDQIQNSKKSLVKMTVTNESISGIMNQFIDHQTEYTKKFVSSVNKVASDMTTELMKNSQDLIKFDYVKFVENINKSFQPTSKKG
jgi:hypothetical protein